MASTATIQSLLFPPPPSVFVTAMTTVSSLAMINAGVNEFRGKHLQYSKLVAAANSVPKLPSKLGMTLIYFPAFLFGAASFFLFPTNYDDTRFFLIRTALTLHFLKRLVETWFVHKYSGEVTTEAAVTISFSYFMATLTTIYAQYLSIGLPEPCIDLKYVGAIMFVIGISGNLYHHYLLSTLRREGEKEYKIPKGGLFDLVICPHYLFELLGFWGFTFITQTVYSMGFTLGTSVYLLGRSHSTRKWYASKFQDFPAHDVGMVVGQLRWHEEYTRDVYMIGLDIRKCKDMGIERLIIFHPPSSWLLTIMTLMNLVSAVVTGFMEAKGNNMQYSKLLKPEPKHDLILVPSRLGMFVVYTPAFLFGVASFFLFPDEGPRFLLLRSALTLHFLKRLLEVMFIHKYSGSMALSALKIIPLGYFLATMLTIYTQHLSRESPQPTLDLTLIGAAMFVVGISGNLYHHYLLSTLRSKGEKEYKIPRGGLFSLVVCPHYLFEVLGYWGIAFIAQTAVSISGAVATTGYLMGRSCATRKWYVSKFEDFPQHVKAVVPYVF